jgi:hypothetical protein
MSKVVFANVPTVTIGFESLAAGDWVVIGTSVKRVKATSWTRRQVTVENVATGGTDTFPADWFSTDSQWTVIG